MLLAQRDIYSEEFIEAEPGMSGIRAICPGCKGEVVARCGDFNVEHWAHINGECKYDSEPETRAHKEWKDNAKMLGMEIEKIFDPNQRFRADIYDPIRNMVTEYQHSPIDMETILTRSSFYESIGIKIRWVFDYIDRYEAGKLELYENQYMIRFKEKYRHKYISCLFDDLGSPKYETYFNIGINYDNHTHTTLKILKLKENEWWSNFGTLFSSSIIEKKLEIYKCVLKDNLDNLNGNILAKFEFSKVEYNKYIRKNELKCNIQEEVTILKDIDDDKYEITYKGYEESCFLQELLYNNRKEKSWRDTINSKRIKREEEIKMVKQAIIDIENIVDNPSGLTEKQKRELVYGIKVDVS